MQRWWSSDGSVASDAGGAEVGVIDGVDCDVAIGVL